MKVAMRTSDTLFEVEARNDALRDIRAWNIQARDKQEAWEKFLVFLRELEKKEFLDNTTVVWEENREEKDRFTFSDPEKKDEESTRVVIRPLRFLT